MAGSPAGALGVLEEHDVVVRAERVIQEPAQRSRLLRKRDQEVVLEPLEDQRPLDHFGIAQDVVVAAGKHADDAAAGQVTELVESR